MKRISSLSSKALLLVVVSLGVSVFSTACRSPGADEDEDESGPPQVSELPHGDGGDSGDGDGDKAGATLVINEFMPSNRTVIFDEGGGSGDWIELFNLTNEAIDLQGYFISDKLDNLTKAELPAGLVIEAGGTLLLWADGDIEQGPAHLPFNLSKDGEAIVVVSPLGEVLDSIEYQFATTDSSFARVPDGTGPFAFCPYPTPLEPNSSACGS